MENKIVIVVGSKAPSAHDIAKRITQIDKNKYRVIVMDEALIEESNQVVVDLPPLAAVEINCPVYIEQRHKIPHLQRGGLNRYDFKKGRK